MNPEPIRRVAIVGFGEAGGIIGSDLAAQGVEVSAFDILLQAKETRDAMLAKARQSKAQAKDSLADCVRDAELVISAVTAPSSLEVARNAAKTVRPGQIFMDINSVSPGTKRAEAAHIEQSGAHYVESAVMAAVPPQRLKVPMLLGGKYAAELASRLALLGMNASAVSDKIGVASAVKMCRSVMIKGMEALAVECLFAARRYGAEDAVLASLDATYPLMGWRDKLPDYLVSRVAEHGKRRAAEMREVAESLRDVGIQPLMADATAERQDWLVDAMVEENLRYKNITSFSWIALAEMLSAASAKKK